MHTHTHTRRMGSYARARRASWSYWLSSSRARAASGVTNNPEKLTTSSPARRPRRYHVLHRSQIALRAHTRPRRIIPRTLRSSRRRSADFRRICCACRVSSGLVGDAYERRRQLGPCVSHGVSGSSHSSRCPLFLGLGLGQFYNGQPMRATDRMSCRQQHTTPHASLNALWIALLTPTAQSQQR